jgi:hypothetical protein
MTLLATASAGRRSEMRLEHGPDLGLLPGLQHRQQLRLIEHG